MAETKSFSQKLHRLEEVVAALEKPDVELEDGLALLEEGIALHQECQQLLTKTQAKIDTLLQQSDKAQPSNESPAPEHTVSTEGTLFDLPDTTESDEDGEDKLPF